jgi:hypothetical protein
MTTNGTRPDFHDDGGTPGWRARHPVTIDVYSNRRAALRAALRRPSVILSLGVLAALTPFLVLLVGFSLLLLWWLVFG